MAITVAKEGARVYLTGDTFPVKDRIKALGGHWDGERRAWWVGAAKQAQAEELAAGLNAAPGAGADPGQKKVADSERVVGKGTYKGRTYYILWMGRTKAGSEKARLTVLDGSIDFWADLALVTVAKRYEPREYRGRTEYQTLGGLRRFVERERHNREQGGAVCAECGRSGDLVRDLEDGLLKHHRCCDIAP